MAGRTVSLTYELGPVRGNADGPGELDAETVADLLETLARRDERYLIANPRTPAVYASRVRYALDPPNGQFYRDIPAVLRYGFADCKSIAAWYAAERRVRFGLPAGIVVVPSKERPGDFHALVATPDGSFVGPNGLMLEDPARVLGMR